MRTPAPKYIVLADVGTDWPEVFGPVSLREDAQKLADDLITDERVSSVAVAFPISRRSFYDGSYWDDLEEATS